MSWITHAINMEESRSMKTASAEGGIEEYLRSMVEHLERAGCAKREGYGYATVYEYFLDNGKSYSSSPLTPEQLNLIKIEIQRHKILYKPKQCFYNAQTLSQHNRGCKYVEGFMISAGVPIIIAHAWNSIDGKVVDFTMSHSNGGKPILGVIPDGWEYFGTEFPSSMISALWARTGTSTPLVDNVEERFPLLKKRTVKPPLEGDQTGGTEITSDNSHTVQNDDAIIL